MSPFVLEPSHAAFSLTNSLACARASLLAYSDDATVIATARDWGFDAVKAFTRGPNHAIVLSNREDIVVAFRGTDALSDWLTNLNILYKRSPLGRGFVHRGFMKAAASFWPELQQHIVTIRSNDQRLVFTGHSLGGALALLASLKSHFDDGVPVAGLYTFGQPPWRTRVADHIRAPRLHGGLSQFGAHSMKDYVELIEARLSRAEC